MEDVSSADRTGRHAWVAALVSVAAVFASMVWFVPSAAAYETRCTYNTFNNIWTACGDNPHNWNRGQAQLEVGRASYVCVGAWKTDDGGYIAQHCADGNYVDWKFGTLLRSHWPFWGEALWQYRPWPTGYAQRDLFQEWTG